MILKDKTDMLIAKRRKPTGTQSPWIFTKDLNQAGCRPVQGSGEVQQRALTATRRTANCDSGARHDSQADVLQNREPALRRFERTTYIVHVQYKWHGVISSLIVNRLSQQKDARQKHKK